MGLAQLVDDDQFPELHLAEFLLLVAAHVPDGLAGLVVDLFRLLLGLLPRLGRHGRYGHIDQQRVTVVVLGGQTVLGRLNRRGDGFDVLPTVSDLYA